MHGQKLGAASGRLRNVVAELGITGKVCASANGIYVAAAFLELFVWMQWCKGAE